MLSKLIKDTLRALSMLLVVVTTAIVFITVLTLPVILSAVFDSYAFLILYVPYVFLVITFYREDKGGW